MGKTPYKSPKQRVSTLLRHLTTKGAPSDALEANNWTNNSIQRNHHGLWSQVLTAHNILNTTMSQWCTCSSQWDRISYIHLCKHASHMHSGWGCASQTPRKPCSRVDAHSRKLWSYVENWAKGRGWALFREWALFPETTVYIHVTVNYSHKIERIEGSKVHNYNSKNCFFNPKLVIENLFPFT